MSEEETLVISEYSKTLQKVTEKFLWFKFFFRHLDPLVGHENFIRQNLAILASHVGRSAGVSLKVLDIPMWPGLMECQSLKSGQNGGWVLSQREDELEKLPP
ncbi:hypothetical protein RRG08_009692 [Elysia crispata]|uniref:Uncharacterized protein n=1 Tax=Elysia crispata TaxID=231223 RepID=A0AAE0XX65_9GAST|nr:hypothetical protein RRG08_009692 [Elysia crispata]